MFLLIYMNENKDLSTLSSDLRYILGQGAYFSFLPQKPMLFIFFYHNRAVRYLLFFSYTRLFI